jgi:hypothetical protein
MTRSTLSAWLALLTATLGMATLARAEEALDVAVKATYLYKLAPFVDWPPTSFPAPDSPFDLCVIGDDPFGPVLDRAVAGQRIAGHPIVIHRMAQAQHNGGCEMAFVAGSRAQPVNEALRQLAGAPVLTVTDSPSSPGIVDFVTDEGRVRFRIDDEAAAESDLTISSKLLRLAMSVVPRRGGGGAR